MQYKSCNSKDRKQFNRKIVTMNIDLAISIYLHIFLYTVLVKNLCAIVVPESNINTIQNVTSSQLNPKPFKIGTSTAATSSEPNSKLSNISTSTVLTLFQFHPKFPTTKKATSSQPNSKSGISTSTVPTSRQYNRDLFNINTSKNVTSIQFNPNLLNHCVRYFVYTFMSHDTRRITVLVNENEDPGYFYAYISQFQYSDVDKQIKLSSYVLDFRNSDVKKTEFSSNNIVIILQHHDSLKYLSVELNGLCSHDCRFAIFLTGGYTERSSFTEEAKKLIEFMWMKKVSNVVIIGQVEGIFLAAESSEFEPNSLPRPMDPAVVGRCSKKIWRIERPLYSAMKMNNCSVNIGYFNEQMYSHRVIKNNNQIVVEGLEVSMVHAIAQVLNFTAYLSMMEWDGRTTKIEATTNKFKNNDSIDLIIGNIHCDDDDENDCTTAFESVSLIWLVPVQSRLSLTGLISPLEIKIWLAMGVVALYTIFVKILLFKKMSFLEILALALGIVWEKQPQRLSYRFKFMSLIIFGFIIAQYYSASLSSSLFTGSRSRLNTMKDLLESTFKIGGQRYLIQLFEFEGYDESYELNDKKEIYNKYIGLDLDSYNKKLYDTMSGKDTSMALIVLLNISSFETQFSPDYVYVLPESLITLSLGFSVRPDLSYFSEIERLLLGLVESGIIGAMGRKLSPIVWFHQGDEDSQNSEDFIRFKNLYPCFLLLITGNILSIFCLLCEIITFKYKSFNDTRGVTERSTEKRKIMMIQKIKKRRHLTLKEQRILFNNRLSKKKFK